jgi:Ca2+-binding EF-hand superfamily protein
MKKFVFGALALSVLAGVALANEPYMPRGEKALERLDTNKDGRVSLEEMKPRMEKRMSVVDINADKTITTAEIDAMLQKRLERRRDQMLKLMDGNRDGSITQAEFDSVVADMFDKADADNNGGVDLAEMKNFRRSQWRKGFVNGNN